MTEPRVVVDIECFRFRSRPWVVKEIAVCGDYIDSMIFRPPHAFKTLSRLEKKAYRWIANNLHGIQWDSGDIPYERLDTFVHSVNLRYPISQFYAKGYEKCLLLEILFQRSFVDLNDLECPNITDLNYLNIACGSNQSLSHSQTHHCSRRKAQCYKDWLETTYSYDDGLYESEFVKELDRIALDN